MGCASSKQKKTESTASSTTGRNAEPKRGNIKSSSKVETVSKPKQPKSKDIECIDDVKLNLQAIQNDANFQKQRPVTPPPVPQRKNRLSKSNTKTWTDEELLCKLKFLDYDTSSNIVRMFDEGSTIPFMCRYRRELIGNLSADE